MHRRATTACLLSLGIVVAGCSGSEPAGAPEAAAPESSAPAPSIAPAPSSAPADTGTESATAACTDYQDSAGAPRRVLEQIADQPVLGPGVALFMLDVQTVATTGSEVGGEVGAAFDELLVALEDLAAQLDAGVPDGELAVETLVEADGEQLSAALDTVDAACTDLGVPPSVSPPPS